MGAVRKPKSVETSVDGDSLKNPDADVVADKLSGLALKQQKLSGAQRRKLVKQRQKLRGINRTRAAVPLATQDRDTNLRCTSVLRTAASGGFRGSLAFSTERAPRTSFLMLKLSEKSRAQQPA